MYFRNHQSILKIRITGKKYSDWGYKANKLGKIKKIKILIFPRFFLVQMIVLVFFFNYIILFLFLIYILLVYHIIVYTNNIYYDKYDQLELSSSIQKTIRFIYNGREHCLHIYYSYIFFKKKYTKSTKAGTRCFPDVLEQNQNCERGHNRHTSYILCRNLTWKRINSLGICVNNEYDCLKIQTRTLR